MAKDIWFISDTHFLHKKILAPDKRGNRGDSFNSVEEMNESMIENWNSVVKQHDLVYHLGDVFIGDKDEYLEIHKRLNGGKRLITGNHDSPKFLSNHFSRVSTWREFREFGFIASHFPLHRDALYRGSNKKFYNNLHGHTHGNITDEKYHLCVSVEQINYTPIHVDEIIKLFAKQNE